MIKKGDDADTLLIIVEGKVEVKVFGKTVGWREAPVLIGENALKSFEKRSADVVAAT